ncbi:STAS/SEC14 domain-containing protein [Steroidobacter sp. S1-65]|uniref:STAS/SEC14 domain-containing protein n=1 Tax=Steroidobacter gossypii TaxID=2805490 RepID=A0ABS1WUS2_9GAMM|nr:STAS/SEC14 domain-containing protein [Steroidobacter gossypii]MBM0104721.1 STAS/SEC14 domain-containing protein [Steroidobacter gossypii]
MTSEPADKQVTVELADTLIVARIRGQPTDAVLQECQAEVLQLARHSGIRKVLYDALQMDPPHFSVPWAQRALDEQLVDMKLRRAVVVPNSKLAFLARLAFGEGDYRVFYEDAAAARQWLIEPEQ